ncbi:hypothetical protein [Streptomyces sp. cg36]|uniref:hypothetical protein n=1 Tax=Streptomyces sp. cg36 TaxID=3238798 RepID=UPI0034E29333
MARSDLIRQACEQRGWGPSDLARAVGVAESGDPGRVHRANANRWMNGTRTPAYWWPHIADVLGLDRDSPGRTPSGPGGGRAPLAALARLTETELPQNIRPGDVEEVQQAALNLSQWHNSNGGGGLVRQTGTGQLAWAAALLGVPCRQTLQPQLFCAVAHLGMVTGAVCFDAFAHHDARQAFIFAAACAEAGGDWHLRCKIYSWRARHAVWTGEPDQALIHAEVASVRAERLTPSERAMLAIARARAHARLGDEQATLGAVGQADEEFSHACPDQDPVWMSYYDHAQHQGDTGHALFDLAMTTRKPQHVQAARERLAAASAQHTDAYLRSRVFSRTKLATLAVITGDVQEAATIGALALQESTRIRSGRADWGLRELALTTTRQRVTVPEAAELCERITRTTAKGAST